MRAAGDAHLYGSMAKVHLNSPIVGIAATPDGQGYWLVAADGGVFGFGNAHYYGSLAVSTHLNRAIVGIAATADGRGYWLVSSDGGIFAFGDARSLRLAGGHSPQPADRGHRRHRRRPRVLVGGLGRRHLCFRGRPFLRLDWARRTSTGPSWASPPPPTAAGTGWSPPTAACSALVTPTSTVRPPPKASKLSWAFPDRLPSRPSRRSIPQGRVPPSPNTESTGQGHKPERE